jgi:hypothetical protein
MTHENSSYATLYSYLPTNSNFSSCATKLTGFLKETTFSSAPINSHATPLPTPSAMSPPGTIFSWYHPCCGSPKMGKSPHVLFSSVDSNHFSPSTSLVNQCVLVVPHRSHSMEFLLTLSKPLANGHLTLSKSTSVNIHFYSTQSSPLDFHACNPPAHDMVVWHTTKPTHGAFHHFPRSSHCFTHLSFP